MLLYVTDSAGFLMPPQNSHRFNNINTPPIPNSDDPNRSRQQSTYDPTPCVSNSMDIVVDKQQQLLSMDRFRDQIERNVHLKFVMAATNKAEFLIRM